MYRREIDEASKTLKLWVRRKRGNRRMECSGCGRKCEQLHDVTEREVRDLPWSSMTATVVVEVQRLRCPDCGVRVERNDNLPGKAPFSKRFEDAVGQACEGASAMAVGRQFGLSPKQVLRIDKRYLKRWNASRTVPALRQMGVDEIYLGKKQKFITVVSNLETGEPLWFGQGRKKETLDGFFVTQTAAQLKQIMAACVDMWEPFTKSILGYAPHCLIVYDRFHIMQHANAAVDEVRRAEFFRQGKKMRDVVRGKRWLLLSRWVNLEGNQRGQLNELFKLNRRVMKAYFLKESLERLWSYKSPGWALRYLNEWIDRLRWQRLTPFNKLAKTLLSHQEGLLNYCRVNVRFGVVEAINGNIKALQRRGRGYRDLEYLLLKARRLAWVDPEISQLPKAA